MKSKEINENIANEDDDFFNEKILKILIFSFVI